jgi:hypothetical protein
MSYNTISGIGDPVRTGASWRPLVFSSISMGDISTAVGKTHSWRSTGDASVSLPSGWSWSRGANTAIASGNAGDWRDVITVPAGNWLVEMKIGQGVSVSYTGQLALFTTTGTRLSNLVSFRDRNRCPLIVARVTGGVSVEVRCVATTINAVATETAFRVASFSFVQIPS